MLGSTLPTAGILMKKISLFIAILPIIIATSPVFAAYDGFYLGILGGAANTHYDLSDVPSITSANIDHTGFGTRLYGGYQWTRNFAAELGYTIYPDTDFKNINQLGRNGNITEAATDLIAKAMLPFYCRLNLYAKAGIAYVDSDRDGDLLGKNENAYRPTYGGGLSYDLNPNIPIGITWMRVQGNNRIANADLLSLGIEYHFG